MTPTLLIWLGCAHTPEPAPEPASEPEPARAPAPAEPLDTHTLHMELHYLAATASVEAVVRGDLDSAREQLGWLGGHPPQASIPVAWWPAIERMQRASQNGLASGSGIGLAEALGQVGAACGGCHRDQGAQVDFGPPPPAPDGTDVLHHMARHAWGLDRMWEALISSRDDRWDEGARMIAREGPSYRHTGGHEGGDQTSLLLAAELHQAAEEALGAPLDRRAGLFGDVLGRCVACHDHTGGGPPKGPGGAPTPR